MAVQISKKTIIILGGLLVVSLLVFGLILVFKPGVFNFNSSKSTETNKGGQAKPLVDIKDILESQGVSLDKSQQVKPAPEVKTPVDNSELKYVIPIKPPETDPALKLGSDLAQQSRQFIRWYGNYSSDSNYFNWQYLKPLMTLSFKKYVDQQQQSRAGLPTDNSFYALKTKVLNSETPVVSLEVGKAELIVLTERVEISAGQEKKYRQKARVIWKKVAAKWLVDGVYWL